MVENIEFRQKQENFESNTERLNFLNRTIVKRVREVRNAGHEEYLKALQAYKEENDLWSIRDEFDKKINPAIIKGLDSLHTELESNPALKKFIPEMNALIEAARTMFLSKEIIKYKEYKFMSGAPDLSEDEITKQNALREDMT